MSEENKRKLYDLLDQIEVTKENRKKIEDIKKLIDNQDYFRAIDRIKKLKEKSGTRIKSEIIKKTNKDEEQMEFWDDNKNDEEAQMVVKKETKRQSLRKYPNELSNIEYEQIYIGNLLNNPKLIVKYYFLYENCYFESDDVLNAYKSVIFTEGGQYTPEKAKDGFNFARTNQESYQFKEDMKEKAYGREKEMEAIYLELSKLFVLRKSYTETPVKEIQDRIVEIRKYKLYNQMTTEEVENAVIQVSVTQKFKQSILTSNLTKFLETGDNNLTNGLRLPFKELSSVFKGIRKGETMAFAMPSNAGKSRFTINLAAYVAFVHQKKTLVISNEMSEEKMKLCLITTILNNPEIQNSHGVKISKTEGELLEFKFRPDDGKNIKTDENGFMVQEKNETRKDFIKRLTDNSTEFNKTVEVTKWVDNNLSNLVYFINITDHTNDELKKVIMNYYYKEKIEYMFYDTLKTDTANIGNPEEIKRTATILSNLAQNFGIFICSTLQLAETQTKPINLDINDLAVSRTVKEVLDTLCLIKQISRNQYDEYEYSIKEVDTEFFELEKFDDPDVRYYACVVDKNRAGAKPKLLFRLNLAYNSWNELGYLRLKSEKDVNY